MGMRLRSSTRERLTAVPVGVVIEYKPFGKDMIEYVFANVSG